MRVPLVPWLYALRSGWTRLLGDYFSVAIQPEMTMEQACRLCNLALQEPWQGLINLQVLDEFRDSDGSILNLRSKTFAMSVAPLPRGLGELWAVTTLRLPALNSLPEELTAVLQNLTKESFVECIKCVKRLPESIVDHPHL